jgi:hypothetical protein
LRTGVWRRRLETGRVIERVPVTSLRVRKRTELLGGVVANQKEIRFHD